MKWISAFLLAFLMVGCTSVSPAGMGKTKAKTSFKNVQPSTIDPVTLQVVPGESLEYDREVQLPAGVSLEGNDGMSVGVNSDGSYNVNVNQTGKIDTTVQAQMLTTIAELQAVTIRAVVEGLVAKLPELIAQYLSGTALMNSTDSAADQAKLDSVLQAFKPLIEAEVNRQTRPSAVVAPPLTGTMPLPMPAR